MSVNTWCRIGPTVTRSQLICITVLVHTMCKDGWVCDRDEDGAPPVVGEWHEGPAQTCEMVFRGKVGRGDYHKNFDGDMFMKWINERLVPTVQHK